mgnify:CR=1 FL=1
MKKMMAVYDADTRYAERLSDYVNRKEKGVFIAQVFTSKEKLAEYAKKHEIDVLLSGERTDSGDISGIRRPRRSICLRRQRSRWILEKRSISSNPGTILSGR